MNIGDKILNEYRPVFSYVFRQNVLQNGVDMLATLSSMEDIRNTDTNVHNIVFFIEKSKVQKSNRNISLALINRHSKNMPISNKSEIV